MSRASSCSLREPGVAPPRRQALFDLTADDFDQRQVVPRLLDEAARAAAHGLDRRVDAAPAGHHDDRQCAVVRSHAIEQFETLTPGRRVARVIEIHEQQVVRPFDDPIEHAADGADELRLESRRRSAGDGAPAGCRPDRRRRGLRGVGVVSKKTSGFVTWALRGLSSIKLGARSSRSGPPVAPAADSTRSGTRFPSPPASACMARPEPAIIPISGTCLSRER